MWPGKCSSEHSSCGEHLTSSLAATFWFTTMCSEATILRGASQLATAHGKDMRCCKSWDLAHRGPWVKDSPLILKTFLMLHYRLWFFLYNLSFFPSCTGLGPALCSDDSWSSFGILLQHPPSFPSQVFILINLLSIQFYTALGACPLNWYLLFQWPNLIYCLCARHCTTSWRYNVVPAHKDLII